MTTSHTLRARNGVVQELDHGRWHPFAVGHPKRFTPEGRAEIGLLLAAAPEMLDLLTDLLDQVTGPAGVWGDGRGRTGEKDGLSGEEFNARKAERIERASALLARVTP